MQYCFTLLEFKKLSKSDLTQSKAILSRIQEIILYTTKNNPHQSTHTQKICSENKTNIPATQWILCFIHHKSKINTVQCNVLMQFSSIKQRYILISTSNTHHHKCLNFNFHTSSSIDPILRHYEK